MIDPDTAMTFLDFVAERHRVWQLRQQGAPQPWTEDPILRRYKFTNVFRVLDPGSQFVFDLAHGSERDVLARLFLYRYTNLPATWLHVLDVLGEWPGMRNLNRVAKIIKEYRDAGNKVFSGAYVILPQPGRSGDKVDQAVQLTKDVLTLGYDEFMRATTQIQRLDALRQHYGVGDFMAMQVLTDWGYTMQCGEDRENDFVIAGPGSTKGARFLAPSTKPMDVIQWARSAILDNPDCPVLPSGRVPSLMDVQNCLCEFSKYVRFSAKPVELKEYRPAHPGPQPAPVLPQHWKDIR